jgi:hypothetical protein
LVAECGELKAGGGDGGSGDGVVKAGWTAFYTGVDIFFAPDKPAGFFEAGEHWVQGTASQAGTAHDLEAVAEVAWVFEEDLEDLGHVRRDTEVLHDTQCMSST